jgi:glutamate dehydrogenase
MQETLEERKQALIDTLVGMVAGKVPGETAADVEEWVRQYYNLLAPADMVYTQPATLLGGALSLWQFGAERAPDTARVRVFNPHLDAEGWETNHTILEVANDDMPFLVDSVMAELNRMERYIHVVIHPVVRVFRDAKGRRTGIARRGSSVPKGAVEIQESYMHIEFDQETTASDLEEIRRNIERVLEDVRLAVRDWQSMQAKLIEVVDRIESERKYLTIPSDEIDESLEFLRWLADDHFVFLGYRRYDFKVEDGKEFLRIVPESGLGVLSQIRTESEDRGFQPFSPEFSRFARRQEVLVVAKANNRSTVHRPVHMDRIGIRRFDQKGNLIGEDRFLGLFTSVSYSRSVSEIPFLRRKAARTIERSGLPPGGHDGKALIQILETLPRDEMFQITEDELFHMAMGILQLQDRLRIAYFMRKDVFERFVSCLVYVPRDRYTSSVRERIKAVLADAYKGTISAFYTQITDSPLARGHFIVKTTPGQIPDIDPRRIEAMVADAARTWSDNLRIQLIEREGEERGLEVHRKYADVFPVAYQEAFEASDALYDVDRIERLLRTGEVEVDLYRYTASGREQLHCKIIHLGRPVALSRIMPHFENMGLRVTVAVPYDLRITGVDDDIRIMDFELDPNEFVVNIDAVRGEFKDAFRKVWKGEMEDDGFNRLVVQAGLDWSDVIVLRAYCKYLRQIGTAFSEAYMQETMAHNPEIARSLVELFNSQFNPELENREAVVSSIRRELEASLERVSNVDEDRILRRFLNLVDSTLRTNHYQKGPDGEYKPYLSMKFDSSKVIDLPSPRPMFEIFVYSPRVEGVHLRGGKVARGGLRWSDRREDFRTEILGLVKAQMVKNAVIVPVGSKGGFVLKRPPVDRAEYQNEGVECYKTFIRGLLDLTDNIVGDSIVPPKEVVRLDEDDPYLVVAADKGTATFSDIANGVSAEYGFWLGDAFASGGSVGYDHKKMGITARGAWEAVKRHFRELGSGRNIQEEDFTVVGVGDMSGDVFGNGMLLSRHIRLVGAFNHMHVFVDPDPDPETSWVERKRLFDLPRSAWMDYDKAVLSKGGGVFDRKAKSITVSDEVKALFELPSTQTTPNDLIRALLRADVDLLWLGGIGTYVKSSEETHAQAADRANDAVRVDATAIRAKVVGEGANLGLTQRGRIEFALVRHGRINTDAIDNSAGVDTSDHEVNIKILLDAAVRQQKLDAKRRVALLTEMTDEVGTLVLRDNYQQTQALTVTESLGLGLLDQQARFIRALERVGKLDRAIEYLPDDETFAERAASRLPLTRPELAVLLAYAKIDVYQSLLDSDVPDDPLLAQDLLRYFPVALQKGFREGIESHRLRREIIATFITNSMVNRVGPTFVHHLSEETGRSTPDIARAYSIVRDAFDLRSIWTGIEDLDNKVPAALQASMLVEAGKLLERATLWLLRNDYQALDISKCVDMFQPRITALSENLQSILPPEEAEELRARATDIHLWGFPADLAARLATLDKLGAACDIVKASIETGKPVESVGAIHFSVGQRLLLDRLRAAAASIAAESPWQKAAISIVLDDSYAYHSRITSRILASAKGAPGVAVQEWLGERPGALARVDQLIQDVRAAQTIDLAMLTVALRHLRTLAEG